MYTKQTYRKTFLLLKENANSKAVPKMDTHQTESTKTENSFHMVATSSTLVMHRTLWMAPTFCTATMAFGTLAFPHTRVCTHSVLTRSWPLNYYYHLEEVSGLLMHFNWAWLFSFVATCTDPGLIDRGERNGTDFSHGQVVTYECSTKNYNLVGNPRLTCNDGVWDSAPPVCKSEYPKIYIFWCFLLF